MRDERSVGCAAGRRRSRARRLLGPLAVLAASACEPADTGVPYPEGPPETLGVLRLAAIDCTERTDTGYVRGEPFTIRLVTVDGEPVELSTANAYWVMQQAAAADGVAIRVVSGFRTMAEQEYFYHCGPDGCCCCNSCNLAAPPGYSNHQSGHALDLNTASGGVLRWLNAHGGSYGFSRTVPSEDWHWEWWGGGPGGGPCGCRPETEVCDDRDNDCDGAVDEGLRRDCGSDIGECTRGQERCERGRWVDCSGREPVPERCDDRDNDCDRATDEALTRPCGTDVGECELGAERCAAGSWGACTGAVDPVPETCDERDNDCDAESDEERICDIEEAALPAPWLDPGVSSDLDGDGRADLCARGADGYECRLATGHGFETVVSGPVPLRPGSAADPSVWAMLRTGDVDGDGRADLCARDGDELACWRSTGRGFGTRLPGPSLAAAGGCRQPSCYTTLRLADVTGDGRADLCFRAASGFRCHPSLGAGFGPAGLVAALSDEAGCDDVSCYATIRLGDVDGDGLVDLCARGAAGMRCWRSTGAGFAEQLAGPPWSDAAGWQAIEYAGTIRLGDVDGDGRADLCGRAAAGFRCFLRRDTAFEGPVVLAAMADADGWADPSRWSTIRLADIDGDGAADVCARDADGLVCWPWDGVGFGRRVAGPPLSDGAGWNARPRYRSLRTGDANGDGAADVCARDAAGLRCWLAGEGGFAQLIFGPAWSDDDGWAASGRQGSLVFAGGGRGGGVPGGAPGGCACAVPRPGGGASGAAWLVLGAVGWLLARGVRLRSTSGRRSRRR